MRKVLMALLLASTLATSAQAQAQQRPAPPTELQAFVGEYTLSDGRVLTISRQRGALLAKFDGQEAVTLQAAGPARFTSRTGALRIVFDQRANGNVAGITQVDDSTPSLARR